MRIKYFYPLIIFIFVVNYHFYSFYQKSFLSMLKIISQRKEKSLYEKIQSQHPYYEVWQIINSGKKILFINHSKDDKEIDYNTTYFKNIKSKNKTNYYLSELKLFILYYSYPNSVPVLDFYEAVNNFDKLKKIDYIISDFELESFYREKVNSDLLKIKKTKAQENFENKFMRLYIRLKRLELSDKQYLIINRHKEKPYYIYKLIF